MSPRRLVFSDPYRGSWLSTLRMSCRCRFRGSFGVIILCTPLQPFAHFMETKRFVDTKLSLFKIATPLQQNAWFFCFTDVHFAEAKRSLLPRCATPPNQNAYFCGSERRFWVVVSSRRFAHCARRCRGSGDFVSTVCSFCSSLPWFWPFRFDGLLIGDSGCDSRDTSGDGSDGDSDCDSGGDYGG